MTGLIGYRWKCSDVWSQVVLITQMLPFFIFLAVRHIFFLAFASFVILLFHLFFKTYTPRENLGNDLMVAPDSRSGQAPLRETWVKI